MNGHCYFTVGQDGTQFWFSGAWRSSAKYPSAQWNAHAYVNGDFTPSWVEGTTHDWTHSYGIDHLLGDYIHDQDQNVDLYQLQPQQEWFSQAEAGVAGTHFGLGDSYDFDIDHGYAALHTCMELN